MLSVCGTIDLDLGQATLDGPETTLHIRDVFGTVTILVPRGVEVSVDGGGPFGTREIDLPDIGPVATPQGSASTPPEPAERCA